MVELLEGVHTKRASAERKGRARVSGTKGEKTQTRHLLKENKTKRKGRDRK